MTGAPALPDGVAAPGLDWAFTIRAEIGAARSGGAGPLGERLHIPITGGTVAGPRLNGTITPGGSDWALLRRDGASAISARYTIVADDGTPIMVANEGLRVSTPDITARLRAGEAVAASSYYFRSTPRFEAPDGAHGWLNRTVFVASLHREAAGIAVVVYAVG